MDRTTDDIIYKLKRNLEKVEHDIEVKERELNELLARKEQIVNELGRYSDEEYESVTLAKVYEQRRKKK